MESLEGNSEEEAKGIAKLLDESGHVLVLKKTVYFRPYKVYLNQSFFSISRAHDSLIWDFWLWFH